MTHTVSHETATKFILTLFREARGNPPICAEYGYDLYVRKAMVIYIESHMPGENPDNGRLLTNLSPGFLSAAWELARRGVIRPGVRGFNHQSTESGSAGMGFSITPFGEAWLKEPSNDVFIPTEPEKFGAMIAKFKGRFGPGFHQRAQEAVRCYGAHAYYACCVMCGASLEAALLAIAIVKTGDERKVLEKYSAASGRSYIEQLILGGQNEYIEREIRGIMILLKHWRDTSAHGKPVAISEDEAFTSLALLLRGAGILDSNWDTLSSKK